MAEEHDSWIATLGVNISASTTPTLKDSDFPTDARARKAADQEALKTGQARRAAMDQEKGEGPPEEEESVLGALVDKAKKKAEKVWDDVKIPKFGGDAEEKPEDATPLVQFLQDLEDGIEEAQKYIKFIDKHRVSGTKQMTFVIGGPCGLADAVRQRAGLVLALSRLTLTHELARVLLTEQVYRAFTIIHDLPYQK